MADTGDKSSSGGELKDILHGGTDVALFGGQRIRRVWLDDRWYFSVVDVVGLLTEAAEPRTYWAQVKAKLATEGATETLQNLKQLRMLAADGKQRLTDCAEAQTMLRIVQSIPSPKAEPVKHWLATVGAERLEELENPALAIDRARQYYLAQGYNSEWIAQRLRSIVTRDDITAEWGERGAHEGREFAILTDTLHKGTFTISTAEHKAVKTLKKRGNLRDSMSLVELALTSLAEATAAAIHRAHGFHHADGLARAASLREDVVRPASAYEEADDKVRRGPPTPPTLTVSRARGLAASPAPCRTIAGHGQNPTEMGCRRC